MSGGHAACPSFIRPFSLYCLVNEVLQRGEIMPALTEKRVLKQYPWGDIATNSTLYFRGEHYLLNNNVCQKKRTPMDRGTILAPLEVLFHAKKGQKKHPFT